MLNVQKFSYHCHSCFSDGINTVREMVIQAKKLGFSELGITDHLIVHKNIKSSPTWVHMKNNKPHIYREDFKSCRAEFQNHCENIRKIAAQEKFKVYVGFEVDFFTYDGWLEELKEFLASLDYDYIISGNHFLFDDKCDDIYNICTELLPICSNSQLTELIKKHFCHIKKSVESGLFNFVAHLDYVRKIGADFCQPKNFKQEIAAVLAALEKNKIGIEISTKGLRKLNDYYPCQSLWPEIAKRDIAVVISDDAHSVAELGYEFIKTERKLLENNLTKRIRF